MANPTNNSLSGAYRAVWRWHFYAGISTLPVLMLLAFTGALYLFKPEIEQMAYGHMSKVSGSGQWVAPDTWTKAAEASVSGRATSILVPERTDQAVQIKVRSAQGEHTVFVDPYTAIAQGSIKGGGLMDTVKGLHSLSIFGRPFNILVEIVAGWAIILVATGLYLWWPRKRDVAVAVPRASSLKRRPFWRDLHAVTGLYAGAVIAFLAVTGMPWSAVWGDRFMNVMRESGLGRPAAPPAASPWSHAGDHDQPAGTGWTMEGVVLRLPDNHDAHNHNDHMTAEMPTLRSALAMVLDAVDARGMARPYTVSIPSDPSLAYTVAHGAEHAQDARSLYVDGRDGAVKADLKWDQFGVGAKAFEWGIAVHQGHQYGWINRIIMLAGCIAIWLLAISGLVMWWKRRPKPRGMGAPYAPPGLKVRAAVLGIVLPLAIIYPLTGLSLIVAITAERLMMGLARHRSK